MLKRILFKYWPLLIIFAISLLLYFRLLFLYFLQDDFFHLKMAQANSLMDFFNFFSFNNSFGYTFYRPLTTQVYLFLTKSLFGYEPVFFHLVAFLFFLANTVLIYKISAILFKNNNLAYIVSFFYAVNSSNVGTLSYISAFEEIGMAFFFFLMVLTYLQKKKYSWVFLILALMSRENAMILPAVLFLYELFLGSKNWKRVIPYFFIVFLYGVLRIALGIPDSSVYQPVFDVKKVLNGYFWYSAWGFGWPEMLIDFIGPGLKINPNLFRFYGPQVSLIFAGSLISAVLYFMGITKAIIKERKLLLFFWGIFIVGLLPVIFWPWHRFTYYLTVPLFGLLGSYVLSLFKLPKTLFMIGGISLFLTCLVTINLSYTVYWAIGRAKVSENLIKILKDQYPTLPKGASLCFKNDPGYPKITGFGNSSTQAYYALSGENGPQITYNDFSLKVYYEDNGGCESSDSVFPVVAKIIQK